MNKDNYLVSICVPVYGVEKYIERCAVSLFEQTYQNIEYIFVNDCTPDNSIEILKVVLQRYPNRMQQVRIIDHKHNKGLAGARNTAVKEAAGDFIMHVDSDDYVDCQIVEKAINKQKEKDADIVIIDFIRRYPKYEQIFKYSSFRDSKLYCLNVLARKDSNSIWAKLIRRSLYIDNNIECKEGCNQGEDFQVVPKLLYHANIIINLNLPLYFYDCINQNSYTNNFSATKLKQNWESMDIVRDYFANKEKEYLYAIQNGRVMQLADDFIVSAKTSGEVSITYYKYALNELSEIKHEHWKSLPISKRTILYISNNFQIMKLYILATRFLRKAVLKLVSKSINKRNRYCKN